MYESESETVSEVRITIIEMVSEQLSNKNILKKISR